MNIFNASVGSKIVFCHPENGSNYDKKKTPEYLKVGGVYTVSQIDIGSFNTYIYVEEVPNVKFNSVMFDDAA